PLCLALVVNPADAQGTYPREELARYGIGPDRLILLPRRGLKEYFDLFADVDIALDSWPYNGHTTTLDGLWMGVPVVALEGDRRVSRVSAGILRLLGREGLVASDWEGSVQPAPRLAADLPRLVDLRQSLRDRLRASPL